MVVCKDKTQISPVKYPEFTKQDFLAAPSYSNKRDLIEAVWQGEAMTIKEMDDRIEAFLKGCVE